MLAGLEGVAPSAPREVEHIVGLSSSGVLALGSPSHGQHGQVLGGRSQRRRLLIAAVAGVVVVAGTAVGLGTFGSSPRPVRIAFVAGLTGPTPGRAEDMLRGVRLYLSEVNRDGGVRGRRVELVVYDDKDVPQLARQRAEQIAADGRILGVIGHRTSTASLAASPVYLRANIPVITPTATADSVTQDNPWYFRTVFTNSAEGRFISNYLQRVLGENSMTLVAGSDDYGRTLSEGILRGWVPRDAAHVFTLDTSAPVAAASADRLAAQLIEGAPTGTVVLALPEQAAREVGLALRRSGFTGRLFAGDAAGSDEFFQSFAAASNSPGGAFYATAPLISDALTGDGVRWFSAFVNRYGVAPTWRAATSYEAGVALVHALRSPDVSLSPKQGTKDRDSVRRALSDLNSPETSLHGLIGPVWFDADRSSASPVRVGLERGGHFTSAFDQLQPLVTSEGTATSGRIIASTDGVLYQQKRVVSVGMMFNQVSDLAADAEEFEADFFLWLKYTGDDDVTDIIFPNAVDSSTGLGNPLRSSQDGDVTYQLYRVVGTFRTSLNFHDFPFDSQKLSVEVQHRSLPSSSVVYAADADVLSASQRERLTSGANAADPVLVIADWVGDRLDYFQSTVGASSSLGDPSVRGGVTGLSYSRFIAELTIHRHVRSFLVKNLLPLLLLAAATYSSLFFSHNLTGERVTFGITGILTGAVLLAEVTSGLPNVGYTVAIQWGYYVFILLAAGCVFVGIAGGGLHDKGNERAARRLDLVARAVYPGVTAAAMATYYFRYR